MSKFNKLFNTIMESFTGIRGLEGNNWYGEEPYPPSYDDSKLGDARNAMTLVNPDTAKLYQAMPRELYNQIMKFTPVERMYILNGNSKRLTDREKIMMNPNELEDMEYKSRMGSRERKQEIIQKHMAENPEYQDWYNNEYLKSVEQPITEEYAEPLFNGRNSVEYGKFISDPDKVRETLQDLGVNFDWPDLVEAASATKRFKIWQLSPKERMYILYGNQPKPTWEEEWKMDPDTRIRMDEKRQAGMPTRRREVILSHMKDCPEFIEWYTNEYLPTKPNDTTQKYFQDVLNNN